MPPPPPPEEGEGSSAGKDRLKRTPLFAPNKLAPPPSMQGSVKKKLDFSQINALSGGLAKVVSEQEREEREEKEAEEKRLQEEQDELARQEEEKKRQEIEALNVPLVTKDREGSQSKDRPTDDGGVDL